MIIYWKDRIIQLVTSRRGECESKVSVLMFVNVCSIFCGFLVTAILIPVHSSGFLKLSTRFNTTRLATRAIPAANIHVRIHIVAFLPLAYTVANMKIVWCLLWLYFTTRLS